MPLALGTSVPAATGGPVAAGSPGTPPIQQTDLDALLKMIPTEVLCFYTAAVAVVPKVGLPALLLFVVGLGLVPIVLFFDGRTMNAPARWPQYVVRMLAFVAWANAITNPFDLFGVGVDALSWLRAVAVLLIPLIGHLLIQAAEA